MTALKHDAAVGGEADRPDVLEDDADARSNDRELPTMQGEGAIHHISDDKALACRDRYYRWPSW